MAYTFRPDVLFTVGVDVTQGRIVVQHNHDSKAWQEIHEHYLALRRALEAAAHLYCVKERTRLGIYKRDCSHPAYRIKKKRYVVGEASGPKKTKVEITQHAYFCTRCGAKVRDA